ncbi:hypothetical protein [Rugamonas apoptosis]|uniref:Uncharacterized protein n=1 Tax=Rugamonas apoptosis TaxID=2758570 RepID=A0A7W2IJS7_9BURK|nr:hypothetical protein [Rugamonas apoptosis]MBA5686824.1 hypothetical protein [Rugamonas apoptosis]
MNQHVPRPGRESALNITIDRDGTRIHRLVDDVIYPVRASRAIARRDPMVEALFGAPKVRRPKNKQ